MGTGKSLTAIAAIGTGYKLGKVSKVLIVAPASVCAVWPAELARYAAFPYEARVLLGEKKKRLKLLEELHGSRRKALKVAVINYESTYRDEIFEALTYFDADMVIADESQRIKTHNAAQSKAMHAIGDKARYKLILSGTPVQNNAADIFSQYRFLDPSVFGRNYYAFRAKYAVMGGFNMKQIIGYRNVDELVRREMSIAYRVTKAEALDLPEQTFEERIIPMDTGARRIYDSIRRESFAELESGGEVTAATALVKLLRLQQIAGGFVTEDSGGAKLVFKGKLDALSDILHDYVIEGRKKIVIFARFLAEIGEIERLAESILSKAGLRAVSVHGAIKKEARGEIIESFQSDESTAAIIGQIDTLGTGVTLTAADTCIYYSTTFNYATYDQSLSRIHRIGQRNTCTYIHLIAENTVDKKILDALESKKSMAAMIVDNWRQYFE